MVPIISHQEEMKTATPEDKREIRDAATHLVNAYSVVGNSDAVRDLMERLSSVDVPPDQHLFNALLRSEVGEGGGRAGGEERQVNDATRKISSKCPASVQEFLSNQI